MFVWIVGMGAQHRGAAGADLGRAAADLIAIDAAAGHLREIIMHVDILPTAVQLSEQLAQCKQAYAHLAAGGTVVGLTTCSPDGNNPIINAMPAGFEWRDPALVNAVMQALESEIARISSLLSTLGITGLSTPAVKTGAAGTAARPQPAR
jgi:hypothetical protein